MSYAITHFAVGQACTLFALSALPVRVERRTAVAVAGGLWAVLPDAHHLLPSLRGVTKPVFHDTVLANLFWFHGLLDAFDSPHSYAVAAAALAVLLAVSFVSG